MDSQQIREMTPADLLILRKFELGMSKRDLAAAVGTVESTVWRWETGRRPISRPTAKKLAALRDFTDSVVERVAAVDPIVTYWSDEAFWLGESTRGWALTAGWHHAVAARAKRRTGARIVFSDGPGPPALP